MMFPFDLTQDPPTSKELDKVMTALKKKAQPIDDPFCHI